MKAILRPFEPNKVVLAARNDPALPLKMLIVLVDAGRPIESMVETIREKKEFIEENQTYTETGFPFSAEFPTTVRHTPTSFASWLI